MALSWKPSGCTLSNLPLYFFTDEYCQRSCQPSANDSKKKAPAGPSCAEASAALLQQRTVAAMVSATSMLVACLLCFSISQPWLCTLYYIWYLSCKFLGQPRRSLANSLGNSLNSRCSGQHRMQPCRWRSTGSMKESDTPFPRLYRLRTNNCLTTGHKSQSPCYMHYATRDTLVQGPQSSTCNCKFTDLNSCTIITMTSHAFSSSHLPHCMKQQQQQGKLP